MVVVKICGITELEQACWALDEGADLLGFVLAPSRRQLSPEAAAEIIGRCRQLFPPDQRPWKAVGVFANQPLGFVQDAAALSRLDRAQLSGREPASYCRRLTLPVYRALHLPEVLAPATSTDPTPRVRRLKRLAFLRLRQAYGATRLVLDSGGAGRWGGTGTTFSWDAVGDAAADCLVAGGLDPDNVARAISTMKPWGVDVSSGVESLGNKDRALIKRFIREAKGGRQHGHDG